MKIGDRVRLSGGDVTAVVLSELNGTVVVRFDGGYVATLFPEAIAEIITENANAPAHPLPPRKSRPRLTDHERERETTARTMAGAFVLATNMIAAGIACRVCHERVAPGGRYSAQGEPGRKTYLCPDCWADTLVPIPRPW